KAVLQPGRCRAPPDLLGDGPAPGRPQLEDLLLVPERTGHRSDPVRRGKPARRAPVQDPARRGLGPFDPGRLKLGRPRLRPDERDEGAWRALSDLEAPILVAGGNHEDLPVRRGADWRDDATPPGELAPPGFRDASGARGGHDAAVGSPSFISAAAA